jgi:hypothetical protein
MFSYGGNELLTKERTSRDRPNELPGTWNIISDWGLLLSKAVLGFLVVQKGQYRFSFVSFKVRI